MIGCSAPVEAPSEPSPTEEPAVVPTEAPVEEPATEEVVLLVAERSTPKSMNPNWQQDSGVHSPASSIFSHLVVLDWGVTQGVTAYGDLAKDWEISDDGTVYTFHLYEGVTWHDGKPLTSADVKYTFETIIEKEYPLANYLKGVKEIRTPDDNTVVVELNEAQPSFVPLLAQATNWYGKIMPKHLYEGTDWDTSPANEHPIGSGPFKFVEWVPESHTLLEANDDYFRGRPAVDKVIFQYVPDTNVAVTMFQSGEMPYLVNHYVPSFGEIAQMMEDPEESKKVVQTDSIYGRDLYINLREEPLSDPKVREALAYAIDRDAINQTAFLGMWPPMQNAGIPVLGEFLNPEALHPDHDPARAEELLDEAGYPKGDDGWRFPLRVTNPTIADTELIAEVLVQQLRQVGIEATWEKYDSATWNEKIKGGDFDVSLYYVRYGPDPDAYSVHFETGAARNFTGYSNPEVDELLTQARFETDHEKRVAAYHRIQEILVKDRPMINLFQQRRFSFVNPEWSGFAVQEDGFGTSISWFGVYGVKPPSAE
jgi:peptide/nickel transport system substrate-binding protein